MNTATTTIFRERFVFIPIVGYKMYLVYKIALKYVIIINFNIKLLIELQRHPKCIKAVIVTSCFFIQYTISILHGSPLRRYEFIKSWVNGNAASMIFQHPFCGAPTCSYVPGWSGPEWQTLISPTPLDYNSVSIPLQILYLNIILRIFIRSVFQCVNEGRIAAAVDKDPWIILISQELQPCLLSG
jgi:hypothetical protein